MKLSKNLTLAEVTKSQTAERHGIDNTPTTIAYENLLRVANEVFQPIRDHFGVPIAVTSGYRCPNLNLLIGGSSTSSHMKGEALDIDGQVFGGVTNKEIFDWARKNLLFDQIIFEFGTDTEPAWVHISIRESGNRCEVLQAKKLNNRTQYLHYHE